MSANNLTVWIVGILYIVTSSENSRESYHNCTVKVVIHKGGFFSTIFFSRSHVAVGIIDEAPLSGISGISDALRPIICIIQIVYLLAVRLLNILEQHFPIVFKISCPPITINNALRQQLFIVLDGYCCIEVYRGSGTSSLVIINLRYIAFLIVKIGRYKFS